MVTNPVEVDPDENDYLVLGLVDDKQIQAGRRSGFLVSS